MTDINDVLQYLDNHVLIPENRASGFIPVGLDAIVFLILTLSLIHISRISSKSALSAASRCRRLSALRTQL